ncbi:NAD(P)-dependent oxidoreductase [Actinopolymorpha alba]|uniref:NAD(P)-dependent oxidoreductase n=1 Tax=Actinopolymorpha alba TaxID=533267 RepID=UPI00037A32FE|nr:NAD(P)H-binding protein [Actinopolymorpha alba]
MKVVVFGAGGRAGRRVVTEAQARGHQVTAVVRDPAKYPHLSATGVTVVAGDVTDPASVAAAADGHDAAVSTVADLEVPADAFYVSATNALLAGLPRAGVGRLLVIGISVTLETEPGVRVLDGPDFPPEYLPFCLGHAAGLETLRAATTTLDWLVISPAGDFDHDGTRAGRYTLAGAPVLTIDEAASNRITYDDFAIAVLDEIDTPTHHRTQLAVAT